MMMFETLFSTLEKASLPPSGDQAGCPSATPLRVTRVAPVPLAAIT